MSFAKGAEEFALSTKLTERVGKWQAKLTPILEEEERRSAFDIHQYSQQLLDSAQQGIQRLKRKSDGSQHVSFCKSTFVFSFIFLTKSITVSSEGCCIEGRL